MKISNIYTKPFLTSWPVPFSGKDFQECFSGSKKRMVRLEKRIDNSWHLSETKEKIEELNFFKFLLNSFSDFFNQFTTQRV